MRGLVVLLALSISLLACSQKQNTVSEEQSKVINITALQLKQLLKKSNNDIQLLDVRTPNEWKAGVIKGALKLNVFDAQFDKKVERILNKNKAVYVYCRSGRRSLIAAEKLLKKGYKVYNLVGGYKAWLSSKK